MIALVWSAEKIRQTQTEGHFTKYFISTFEILKVMKNKDWETVTDQRGLKEHDD